MKVLELGLARIACTLGICTLVGCPNNPVGDDAFVVSGMDAFAEEIDAPGSSPDAVAEDDVFSAEDAFAEPDAYVAADAPFDAGPPDAAGPPCGTEGMRRSQSCSCDAVRIETCTGGAWRTTTPCAHPRGFTYECEPGTVERWVGERCNLLSRTCSAICQWEDPVYETPPGECDMGMTCRNGCPCTAECRCLVMEGGECI